MRRGDDAAANEFHAKWSARVRAFAGRRLPPEQADELQAAFFERCWRLVGEDHAWTCPFTTYLWRIVANAARDLGSAQARRRKRARSLASGADDGAAIDVPSSAPSPERQAIQAEIVAKVRAALLELGPGDQHILVACLVDGDAGQDVAAALGLDRDALYQRLHRARKKLEAQLEKAGILPDRRGRRVRQPR
jgi:RNA polymerase sigma-70 factor (ECF subfamily)